MRSNFNSLLLALAMLDNMVVIISIWDNSVVKIFHVYFEFYIYMFPSVWFPIKVRGTSSLHALEGIQ